MLRLHPVAPLLLALGCGATPSPGDAGALDASGESAATLAGSDDGAHETTAAASTGTTSSGGSTEGETSVGEGSSTGEPVLPPAIGLVQYDADAHFGDTATNRENLTTWALAAVEQGAKIIVFPEGSTHGYASATQLWCAPGMATFEGRSCRDVSSVAEPLPGGPTTEYWSAFAAEHDVAIVFHVPEIDDGLFYASLGVVGPDGFVTRYRKRSLYYVDTAYATPGDDSVVVDTPWGRFGLMICLDGTYDGAYYDEYLAAGVDGIIIAMDWDDDPNGEAAAITWFRERAFVNDVRIYAADVPTWDGTGLYPPGDVPRERNGLPAIAIGVEGLSVHPLPR